MSTLAETVPAPIAQTPSSRLATVAQFALTSIVTAASVAVGGWMSSLSMVMYAASVSLLTFAFLPLVLIVLGIALPFLAAAMVLLSMVVAIIAPFAGAAAAPIDGEILLDGTATGIETTRFGFRIFSPYYKWLMGTRHPVLWGAVVGVVLGTGALWGLITWHVLPREAKTAEILVATREAVLERFKATNQMPPVNGGQLLYKDIAIELPGPVVDGFGQPLEYDVQLPSFRLKSRGFDQRPGSDDFCTTGVVELNVVQKLTRWKDVAKNLAKQFDFKIENGKLKIRGQLGLRDAAKLITELRCTE